jgi:hypothetical protein
LIHFNLGERRVRSQQGPLFAGYPAPMRRVLFWYDRLTEWQRVQYAVLAMLFLLACGGYLLGLGSTIVLRRVEMEEAALAALPLPTVEPAATVPPTVALVVVSPTSTRTAVPSPSATAVPTAPPTLAPFNVPVIAEAPAVPRQLPAAPVIAPAAPVPVAPPPTPTAAKPRNLETSKPEPPAASVATPTPGLVRTVAPVVPTAVRQATPTTRGAAGTPLPTFVATPPPPRPTTAPTPTKTPTRR